MKPRPTRMLRWLRAGLLGTATLLLTGCVSIPHNLQDVQQDFTHPTRLLQSSPKRNPPMQLADAAVRSDTAL